MQFLIKFSIDLHVRIPVSATITRVAPFQELGFRPKAENQDVSLANKATEPKRFCEILEEFKGKLWLEQSRFAHVPTSGWKKREEEFGGGVDEV